MADGWKTKTTGLDKVFRRIEAVKKAPRSIGVRIGVKATSGTVKRKHGTKDASRTAGENIIAIRANAKKGRRLAALASNEQVRGNELWRRGTRELMRANDPSRLMIAATRVGEHIVKSFESHIEEGRAVFRGQSRAMRPVKRGTQKRKDREGIRPGLPPMYRTGQLLEAFKVTVYSR